MSTLSSITLPGGIYFLSYEPQNLIGAADVRPSYAEKFEWVSDPVRVNRLLVTEALIDWKWSESIINHWSIELVSESDSAIQSENKNELVIELSIDWVISQRFSETVSAAEWISDWIIDRLSYESAIQWKRQCSRIN